MPGNAGDAGGIVILDSGVEHGNPGASSESSDSIPQQPTMHLIHVVMDGTVPSPSSTKDSAASADKKRRQQKPSHVCHDRNLSCAWWVPALSVGG